MSGKLPIDRARKNVESAHPFEEDKQKYTEDQAAAQSREKQPHLTDVHRVEERNNDDS